MTITLTTTEIVAWWGAILATVVFGWDIYKWRTSGPRLRLSIRPNQIVIGDSSREGKTYISIWVTNIGDRPTTLQSLGFHVFEKRFHRFRRFRRKAVMSAIFPNPNEQFPLPHKLEPGTQWLGLMPQSEVAEEAKGRFIEIELGHSHAEHPIRKLLKSEALNEKA